MDLIFLDVQVCTAHTHKPPNTECKIFIKRALSDDTGDMKVMEDFDPSPDKLKLLLLATEFTSAATELPLR